MLDQSIEELRQFVNNYRSYKDDDTRTGNGSTKQYSNDELIKILESDTLNVEEQCEASTLHRTAKPAGNEIRDQIASQIGYNVWKVNKNGVEGLTLEIRESLFSKLNSALSINYKTIFNKKTVLTESSICKIAKKIEFSILSIALDLNSYKLSGAEKVVNIERETHNRSLCEALRTEIELLRMRDETQTTVSKDNSQQLSSALSVGAESISHQESHCRDSECNTESTAVDTADDRSVESPVFPTALEGDSEYYSCSPGGHSPMEIQQNNESCTSNSNTQDPVIKVKDKEKLKEIEPIKNEPLQSISTVDNHVEKNATEPINVVSEIHSNNGKDKIDLPSTDEISLSKKRKRKFECNLGQSSVCVSGHHDKENKILNTRTKNNLPNKKHKDMNSETTLDTSNITTYYYVNNNNVETVETLKLHTRITLEKNIHAQQMDVNVANGTQLIENFKLEPQDIKVEPVTSTPTDSYDKGKISLENRSPSKKPRENCDRLDKNENVISPDGKNVLRNKINQSEIESSEKCTNLNHPNRCRIKSEIDVSRYSMSIDDNESIDKCIGSIAVKNENASSVDTDSCDAISDDTIMQNLEVNFENNAVSSLDTLSNTEITAVEDCNVPEVNANKDCHPNNVVVKRKCLIPEEAFERERARLDRECEKMKREEEMAKLKASERIENESGVLSHDDYKHIFEIIVPIMKKNYPSEFIPNEYSYGKILQRLQIDLANEKMCDADMVSYTKDSIETMRYLCDHCIVQ